MSLHVIVGAGPVGSATAQRLAGQGQAVRLLSRSGATPAGGGVEAIAADATDGAAGQRPGRRRALVTLGADERAWGHAWHVPTSPPMTQRDIFAALARLAGAPAPGLRPVPGWQLKALGVLVPFLREFGEVSYQFIRPFVVDSAAFQATFGTGPTPMDRALTATVTWWHNRGRAAARKE